MSSKSPAIQTRSNLSLELVRSAIGTSEGGNELNGIPVAFVLRDEYGELLGGLLGDILGGWLHVRTLAVAAPVRGMALARIHEALPKLMRLSPVASLHRRCSPRR
jgi:hypothetical protein